MVGANLAATVSVGLSVGVVAPPLGAQTANPWLPVVSGASWIVSVAPDCTASVTVTGWDATAGQAAADASAAGDDAAVVLATVGPFASRTITWSMLKDSGGTLTAPLSGFALVPASGSGEITIGTRTSSDPSDVTVDNVVYSAPFTSGCSYPGLIATIAPDTCALTVTATGLPPGFSYELLFHTSPEMPTSASHGPDVPLSQNAEKTEQSWTGVLPHLSAFGGSSVTVSLTTGDPLSFDATVRGTELDSTSIVVPGGGCVADIDMPSEAILGGSSLVVSVSQCSASATLSGWNRDVMDQLVAYQELTPEAAAAAVVAYVFVGPTAYKTITIADLQSSRPGARWYTFELDGPILADAGGGGTWSVVATQVGPKNSIEPAATVATGRYSGGCSYPTMRAEVTSACALAVYVEGMPSDPAATLVLANDEQTPVWGNESNADQPLGMTSTGNGTYSGSVALNPDIALRARDGGAEITLHGATYRNSYTSIRLSEAIATVPVEFTDGACVATSTTSTTVAPSSTAAPTTTAVPTTVGGASIARTGADPRSMVAGLALLLAGAAFVLVATLRRRRHAVG